MCIVSQCCFCVPLKIACFIIAIIHLCPPMIANTIQPMKKDGCFSKEFSDTIQYVSGVIGLLVFVGAILMLIGLCLSIPWMTLVFMATLLLLIVFTFIAMILLIIYQKGGKGCQLAPMFGVSGIIVILWEIYLLIVVRSYKALEE